MTIWRATGIRSFHLTSMSVNDMWVSFKSEVLSAIERFIPSKMTGLKGFACFDGIVKLHM